MLYKHFFWDFDGTLYDTYARMTRAFVKGMADLGIQTDYDTVYRRIKVSVGYAGAVYAAENPQLNLTQEDCDRAYRVHSEEEGPESMQLYAGIRDMLAAIVEKGGKNYLFVAYGIYGDTERGDNDHQVILCYDFEQLKRHEMPLIHSALHKSGPEKPLGKYFIYCCSLWS